MFCRFWKVSLPQKSYKTKCPPKDQSNNKFSLSYQIKWLYCLLKFCRWPSKVQCNIIFFEFLVFHRHLVNCTDSDFLWCLLKFCGWPSKVQCFYIFRIVGYLVNCTDFLWCLLKFCCCWPPKVHQTTLPEAGVFNPIIIIIFKIIIKIIIIIIVIIIIVLIIVIKIIKMFMILIKTYGFD